MTTDKTISQNAIGRALGLSSASMVKCKRLGMPVHSVAAARAWRAANIAPTMHNYSRRNPTPRPAEAMLVALALMDVAAAALASGQIIDALVPALRLALHAVPENERDPDIPLQVEVMNVLVAEVAAALSPPSELNEPGSLASCDDDMSDDEAAEMGRFWYQVAAGEIRLNPSKD